MDWKEQAQKEYERSKLMDEVMDLYGDCYDLDEGVAEYFDVESTKMLKKKKRILEKIKNGEHGPDIGDDYFDILEDIPRDENGNVIVAIEW